MLDGRLDRVGWATVRDILTEVGPLATAAVQRGRAAGLWELSDEELSVLGELGTVGAVLRGVGRASGNLGHVLPPLHHRDERGDEHPSTDSGNHGAMTSSP